MPANSSVHYQLSRTLRRAGRPEAAAKEAALSEQLGRKEKAGQQVLARANEGLALVQHGHAQEGLAEIKEALAIDPESLTAHFDYALALRHVGRYQESIAELQKVLRMEPDMPAAHYQLGCDYFKQGKYPEAVSSFRRAAGLIPGTAAVHNGLGVALAKNGDSAGAVQEIELAEKLEPKVVYRKNLECVKHGGACALVP
jgi:tetratricopeptide (TPR) repeat protein